MSIQLIVNADDYGHTPGVSDGIRNSHLHGIVTSTTAMMNMPGVEEALHDALQECPRMGLGVHLVLTTGAPLLPAAQVNSLIADDNLFAHVSDLIQRLSYLDLNEVTAEWRAQIEKFTAVTGQAPDHLDSHHHISYFSPGLFRVMLELAQEFGCAIRFPNGATAADIFDEFPPEYVRDCLDRNLMLVDQYQVQHPDRFRQSFYGENATQIALHNLLADLPEGTTEIMCHPGYCDGELSRSSSYIIQRNTELFILTAPAILDFVKEMKIELINYGAL
jgi:predicted glycoside hydrolase/deacetylase ChbG (UPF0249 family)